MPVASRKFRPVLAITVFALYCLMGHAQIEVRPIATYATEQGLSHGTVWTILKGENGFVWAGTTNGLNRFDGLDFTNFFSGERSGGLADNQVRSLVWLDGKLWIGTATALNSYDPVTEQFATYNLEHEQTTDAGATYIYAMAVNRSGKIWIGTPRGLLRFDPLTGSIQPFLQPKSKDRIDPKCWVRTLSVDSDDKVWIGTDGGLHVYDPVLNRLLFFSHPSGDPLANQIRSLYRDRFDRLWVGSSGGLSLFDDSRGQFTPPALPEELAFLQGAWINHITADQSGRIWISTRTLGLYGFRLQPWEILHYGFGNAPDDLPSNNVLATFADDQGLLWVGLYKGGIAKIDLKKPKFRRFRLATNVDHPHEEVWAIEEDQVGNLWLGNRDGLVQYSPKTGIRSYFNHIPGIAGSLAVNSILTLHCDAAGKLWVGTYAGGLHRYVPERGNFEHYPAEPKNPNGLANAYVESLASDRNGNLFVGTRAGLQVLEVESGSFKRVGLNAGQSPARNPRVHVILSEVDGSIWVGSNQGLFHLDPEHRLLKHYQNDADDPLSIGHDMVISLQKDGRHGLWVGTNSGLYHFDVLTEQFTFMEPTREFPSGWISSIVAGVQGELWIGTNAGLVWFKPPAQVRVFDLSDGLSTQEFSRGAAFKSSRGIIYFGGSHGYISFLSSTLSFNPHAPQLALTGMKVLGQSQSLYQRRDRRGTLEIRPGERHFSLEVSALEFTTPGKNNVQYKLEGLNEHWREGGPQPSITYSNLDAGDYTFRAKAANHDGVWSKQELAIPIRVIHPIWRQLWFLSLMVLLLGGLIYGAHVYRLRDIRRTKSSLLRRVDDRTRDLRSVNRHLIENARKAGVAELNTGILHNIGNILTSVTVSAHQIVDTMSVDKTNRIIKLQELVPAQDHHMIPFFTEDPRGRFMIPFLKQVADQLAESHRYLENECEELLDRISLMAHAVSMEQSYAGRFSKREKVDLAELIDATFVLYEEHFRRAKIRIKRAYEKTPACKIGPHKLIHIFTNFIKNALEALQNFEKDGSRWLKISIRTYNDELNAITFEDNGSGILPENLERIFQFGFTTKSRGHGFGLHSARQALLDVGGDIMVFSAGEGKGTKFTLLIPLFAREHPRS